MYDGRTDSTEFTATLGAAKLSVVAGRLRNMEGLMTAALLEEKQRSNGEETLQGCETDFSRRKGTR